MFLSAGYAVLLPDSRGHGAGGGEFVTYGLLERYDVIRWTHWMRTAACHQNLWAGRVAWSLHTHRGGGCGAEFAAIVAECAYADLREAAVDRTRRMFSIPSFAARVIVASGMLYARFADGLNMVQASPIRSIEHATTPILLIHGLDDSRTPPYDSERLARANRNDPLWLAPHTGAAAAAPEEFRRRVIAWFASH